MAAKKLIAMVGAYEPLNIDDRMRLWVPQHRGWIKSGKLDVINLEYGRDFLAEDKQYSVVILHSIFHSNRTVFRPLPKEEMSGNIMQSRQHSVEAWRKRLASSGARSIIVWELLACALSGWNLGQLPGYRLVSRDHRVTLYRKGEMKCTCQESYRAT